MGRPGSITAVDYPRDNGMEFHLTTIKGGSQFRIPDARIRNSIILESLQATATNKEPDDSG